ncbi:hypothetical protein GH714_032610 [Hevea brasiliensis]|uniref:DNA2/NAM7 helicase-like C-terminal domain-containing protein n=1 Tax=Hevea brasiliensis TaxID=3981 RepID=A0A6A6M2C9_HEVBR|nr:hypothetical protein GH714_032610 [Hevea brasiliensis]
MSTINNPLKNELTPDKENASENCSHHEQQTMSFRISIEKRRSNCFSSVALQTSRSYRPRQHFLFLSHSHRVTEAEISASISSGASRNLDSAQKRGSTILNLKCVDAQTGLMGKTLLEFQSNKGDVLPAHKDSSITVAFDDIPEEGLNSPLRLEKVANEVTYRRMKEALIQLSKGVQKGPAADLIPVLFGERPPTVAKKGVTFTPFNSNLDHSSSYLQGFMHFNKLRNLASFFWFSFLGKERSNFKGLVIKECIFAAWATWNWKTTTVVEIILQEVKRGSKILACAASNIAVDNIVERLVRHRIKLVRLGHPARLLPQVLDSALDAQVLKGDNSALAKDIRKEMKALNGKLLKTKDKSTRRDIQRELRSLSKEERKRQQLAVSDVIKNADVVLTTLTGALSHKLDSTSFDLVIIDEAAQALEIACWIALLKVLVNNLDSCQHKLSFALPLKTGLCRMSARIIGFKVYSCRRPSSASSNHPKCLKLRRKALGRTLFERLADLYGDEVTSMLTVQYECMKLIMNWSSKELYDSKIKAHASVAAHKLLILNVCDMEEKKDEEDSTLNEGEAEVAVAHAKRLVESGVQASDIGIITPYAAQVVLLKILKSNEDKLKDMEISTVDGFQGREKEAIIISMVRSNSKKEVGFLSDHRRMNVAVTRARRQCCLVCDTDTVVSDAFLKRLIEYFEEHGEYLSASEYRNE